MLFSRKCILLFTAAACAFAACFLLGGCASAPGTQASVSGDRGGETAAADLQGDIEATPDQNTSPSQNSASAQSVPAPSTPSKGVICIDAGHSAISDYTPLPIGPGADETRAAESSGTSGAVTGTPESQVNLQVALKLQNKLEAAGFTVVMVRTTEDVSVSNIARAQIASDCKANLFIRLHCDGSSNQSASGFSTLVPAENEWTAPIAAQSQLAGSIMHPVVVSETGAADRGIVQRSDLAGFNYSTVPCVLFEMGFLTNPNEEQLLISDAYQNQMAAAIADAAKAYFAQAG